eukprot:TRINITY_DN2001_c0_g1_i1.p4 TRINITY_DN2001_c0_g1~~TRINITY_DN2001_c0_g1_i1.p4  ORF type:complete len:495 (+),score=76.76 TRINITY_DN2001_c0_g1_i1:1582-3066(+)
MSEGKKGIFPSFSSLQKWNKLARSLKAPSQKVLRTPQFLLEEEKSKTTTDKEDGDPELVEVLIVLVNKQFAGIKNLSKDKSYLYSKKIVAWEDEKLKLNKEIIRALTDDLGFDQPSKIQAMTIPMIVEEPYQNLIAQSQNGTGKTLAFVLSSIVRVDPKVNDIQVIVLVPIRELAKQTYGIYLSVVKYTPEVKVSLIIPDSPTPGKGHILVGTPKSLLKLIDTKKKDFEKLKMIVIDEADAVFNPKDEISKQAMLIYKKTNPKKQVVLFSATFGPDIMNNARELVKEATIMKMPVQNLTLQGVMQLYIKCEPKKKFQTILDIYKKITIVQTLVFCNTRHYSEAFYKFMTSNGIKAGLLMGGMTPAERDATMNSFKARETTMLICTNVLARGYDNRFVTFVINLDIPRRIDSREEPDTESYLHRIGRTGRFGDIGIALNIIETDIDMQVIEKVKDFYKCKLDETTLEKLPKQVNEVKKIREQQEAEAEEEELKKK